VARLRLLARIGLAACAAVLGGCVAWWWEAAWAPATIALILVGLEIGMIAMDRRAHRARGAANGATRPADQQARFLPERIAAGGTLLLVASMASMAAVLAAWLLEERTAAIGAYVAFLLMLLLGLPFWLSAIAEEVDTARETQADRGGHD
jgi:hypothetical protein